MTGRAEELRQKKISSGLPELVNASFESIAEDGTPTGWYYARQVNAAEDRASPDGLRVLNFSNDKPGHNSQILAVLGDGRVRDAERRDFALDQNRTGWLGNCRNAAPAFGNRVL